MSAVVLAYVATKFNAVRLVEEAVVLKEFVLVAFVIVTPPVAPTENKLVPELLRIWKRFAA